MNIFNHHSVDKSKHSHEKSFIHNPFGVNFIIILSFLFVALVSGAYLMYSHIIFGGNGIDGGYDMTFHFQRIMDLTKAIRGGDYFPALTFNGMSHNANAMMQLYPYQTLYPIAVLFLFIKPTITSIYIVYIGLIFVALIISYYSSIRISNDRLVSYTFSILYCLSSMVMFYAFEAVDIGALMAMVFLPIALFGFIHLIHHNSWIQLTLGMILLIFSHVLTTFIVGLTFIFWIICCSRQMNLHKWLNLIKATLLTTLITSIWWLPSLDIMLNNRLEYPSSFGLTGATDILHIVTIGLHNSVDMSDMISFFAVIGLLLFLLFWKKFPRYVKQLALVAVIVLALTTSLLPWGSPGVASWIVLTKTPFAILQFPWRLNMIPELCLSYIFAYILVKFINYKKIVLPSVIVLVIIFQLFNQVQIVNEAHAKTVVPLTSTIFHHDKLRRYTKTRYYINQDNQLKYIFNSPTSVSTIYDYYPVAAMPMNLFTSNSQGSYMGTRTVQFNSLGNGLYQFNIKPSSIYGLNLPIIEYNKFKYKTYLDGKPIDSFMGQDHLLVVNVLPHGVHKLRVQVIYPPTFHTAKVFTSLGLAGLLVSIVLLKIKSLFINIREERRSR